MVVLKWVLLIITLFAKATDGGILAETAVWPSGSYGIPKPISGCPNNEDPNVVWKEGWIEQDMEDNKPKSQFSPSFHMEANLTDVLNVKRSFCIKETNQTRNNIEWPKGSYCIYKSGDCPNKMTSGSIEWDDEDEHNLNERFGTLPTGNYNQDTTVYYCCQNQSHWYKSIVLPTNRPFYLLPLNAPRCQRVKWALSSLEYIIYDTEDDDNRDGFNGSHVFSDKLKGLPKIYYCYYYGCRNRINGNTGSLTSMISIADQYPDYQYCSWLITVDQRLIVSLTFKYIHVPDCQENYIDFYDSSNMTSPFLARLCGLNATVHSTVISTGNTLYFVFKSGNNPGRTEKIGFDAQYSARLKPKRTDHELRSTFTPHVDSSNSSTPVIAIILPVFAVLFILFLISITIFYRRMKEIKNIVQNRTNPSYEVRTNFTIQAGESLPRYEAQYENSQEILMMENESKRRECQNPINELEQRPNSESTFIPANNVDNEPTYERIDEIDVNKNMFYRSFDQYERRAGVLNENIAEEEVTRGNAIADPETPGTGGVIYCNIPMISNGSEMAVTEYDINEKEPGSFNSTHLRPPDDASNGDFDDTTTLSVSKTTPEESTECNAAEEQNGTFPKIHLEPPKDSDKGGFADPISLSECETPLHEELPEDNASENEFCGLSLTHSETLEVYSTIYSNLPVSSKKHNIVLKEEAKHDASQNDACVILLTDSETPDVDSKENSDLPVSLNKNEIVLKEKHTEHNVSLNEACCVIPSTESETAKVDCIEKSDLPVSSNTNEIIMLKEDQTNFPSTESETLVCNSSDSNIYIVSSNENEIMRKKQTEHCATENQDHVLASNDSKLESKRHSKVLLDSTETTDFVQKEELSKC